MNFHKLSGKYYWQRMVNLLPRGYSNSTVNLYDTLSHNWYFLGRTSNETTHTFYEYHSTTYDRNRDLQWFLGSASATTRAVLAYDIWLNKYTKVTEAPRQMKEPGWAYDPVKDRFFLFGGSLKNSDLWEFRPDTRIWTKNTNWTQTNLAEPAAQGATSIKVNDLGVANPGGRICINVEDDGYSFQPRVITGIDPIEKTITFTDYEGLTPDGLSTAVPAGPNSATSMYPWRLDIYPPNWPPVPIGTDYTLDGKIFTNWSTIPNLTCEWDDIHNNMVCFIPEPQHKRITAWVFDPYTNEWTAGSAVALTPENHREGDLEVVWMPNRNAFAVLVGHIPSNLVQLLFYRLSSSNSAILETPAHVVISVSNDGGTVSLSWDKPTGAALYRIYRAAAIANDLNSDGTIECSAAGNCDPFGLAWTLLGTSSSSSYTDETVQQRHVYYYRISACNDTSCTHESAPSYLVRVIPKAIWEGHVSVLSNSSQRIEWTPREVNGIDHYNIYRAECVPTYTVNNTVVVNDYVYPEKQVTEISYGRFEKIAEVPVGTNYFVDNADLAGADLRVYAYRVTAVNSLQIEAGFSAQWPTIPSPVRRVNYKYGDGIITLQWRYNPESGIKGYHVFRQKPYSKSNYDIERLTTVPITTNQFIDYKPYPAIDHDVAYYVVAVDALGQWGIPSEQVLTHMLGEDKYWKPYGYLDEYQKIDASIKPVRPGSNLRFVD